MDTLPNLVAWHPVTNVPPARDEGNQMLHATYSVRNRFAISKSAM